MKMNILKKNNSHFWSENENHNVINFSNIEKILPQNMPNNIKFTENKLIDSVSDDDC